VGLMDTDQMKAWILRRFGAPILKVELTDCHLDDAIEQARRWFSAKKGAKRMAVLAVNSAQVEYDLDDDVDTVIDVAFQIPPMDLSLVFAPFTLIDDKVPYDVFAAPSSIGIYSSFTQTLQYVEMAKRILGAEPDWRQEGRKFYIFPVPSSNSHVILFYKSTKVTIEQLDERDHDLVKRYALALAKEDLGRIRSKYDTFPTAQGTVSLDGATLLSEAQAEKENLEEEIAASGFPMLFMTG